MEPIAYSVPTIQPRVCRLPAKPAARSSTYKQSIKIFFADFGAAGSSQNSIVWQIYSLPQLPLTYLL